MEDRNDIRDSQFAHLLTRAHKKRKHVIILKSTNLYSLKICSESSWQKRAHYQNWSKHYTAGRRTINPR